MPPLAAEAAEAAEATGGGGGGENDWNPFLNLGGFRVDSEWDPVLAFVVVVVITSKMPLVSPRVIVFRGVDVPEREVGWRGGDRWVWGTVDCVDAELPETEGDDGATRAMEGDGDDVWDFLDSVYTESELLRRAEIAVVVDDDEEEKEGMVVLGESVGQFCGE